MEIYIVEFFCLYKHDKVSIKMKRLITIIHVLNGILTGLSPLSLSK